MLEIIIVVIIFSLIPLALANLFFNLKGLKRDKENLANTMRSSGYTEEQIKKELDKI